MVKNIYFSKSRSACLKSRFRSAANRDLPAGNRDSGLLEIEISLLEIETVILTQSRFVADRKLINPSGGYPTGYPVDIQRISARCPLFCPIRPSVRLSVCLDIHRISTRYPPDLDAHWQRSLSKTFTFPNYLYHDLKLMLKI